MWIVGSCLLLCLPSCWANLCLGHCVPLPSAGKRYRIPVAFACVRNRLLFGRCSAAPRLPARPVSRFPGHAVQVTDQMAPGLGGRRAGTKQGKGRDGRAVSVPAAGVQAFRASPAEAHKNDPLFPILGPACKISGANFLSAPASHPKLRLVYCTDLWDRSVSETR
jgi:hypothetical protein